MFTKASEIRQCANELIEYLADLPDAKGDPWTQENFRRLDEFARRKNPAIESYYLKHSEKKEFLWDFIASSAEAGIFIAAESEQAVADEGKVTGLKHDFEKLLYVYSPIRILITKARNAGHAKELSEKLAEYAHGCCLSFNPGSVFILHFGLWYDEGTVSYIWQSEGEPKPAVPERLAFELADIGHWPRRTHHHHMDMSIGSSGVCQ
jgi:hypothetical protein